MPGQPRRYLIVGPAWVGDMIMSQVIYSTLRERDPGVQIDVLAPRATLSLVQRMSQVSRGILIDQQHGQLGLRYRAGLGRALRGNEYDQAIVTQNSLKSALVPFFADIPLRTGFLGEYRYFLLNDIRLLDKKRLPRMTDRFLSLVDAGGDGFAVPELMVDEGNRQRFLDEMKLALPERVVGFCPGAEFGDAKKWPEEHYIATGKALVEKGVSVWVFGSPADEATGDRITTGIGDGCTNLAGRTTLLDAIDLISLCDSVVTNDSGLMHVAAAVNVPVVAVYGSTSPGFTPPLSPQAAVIRLELECSPCFKRDCPLGHKNCLVQLSPNLVLDQLSI